MQVNGPERQTEGKSRTMEGSKANEKMDRREESRDKLLGFQSRL